ncbi:MAG: Bpu10I family restriction endonuclease, partial [Gemmataceae bacterium]|nr:Bpu10I family restriction endonuclease [Gemmataceae bacterium]
RYAAWVAGMDSLTETGDALLQKLVSMLNDYKRQVDVELIYDSASDFLYRQSGQLKVANSILEEFLPRLADARLVPGLGIVRPFRAGPQKAFAAFTIVGNAVTPLGSSLFIKQKDQDYAVSKQLHLRASTTPAFSPGTTVELTMNVAYFAAECKTNLDKTMFNEGVETARALKQAVASARYLLLCEWLDMPPIDTRLTEINEAIILRKAKRLAAGFREKLATVAGRKAARGQFVDFYDRHPLDLDCFRRIINHMAQAFPAVSELEEDEVLARGYF